MKILVVLLLGLGLRGVRSFELDDGLKDGKELVLEGDLRNDENLEIIDLGDFKGKSSYTTGGDSITIGGGVDNENKKKYNDYYGGNGKFGFGYRNNDKYTFDKTILDDPGKQIVPKARHNFFFITTTNEGNTYTRGGDSIGRGRGENDYGTGNGNLFPKLDEGVSIGTGGYGPGGIGGTGITVLNTETTKGNGDDVNELEDCTDFTTGCDEGFIGEKFEGFDPGFTGGFDEGLTGGFDEGFTGGYDGGFTDVYDTGFTGGFDEGFTGGYDGGLTGGFDGGNTYGTGGRDRYFGVC